MQNKELFKRAYKEIKKAHYILLVTHKNPDADTITCSLSLSNFFYENKIKHKVYNLDIEMIPRNLNFLVKFEKITDKLPIYYDLIIYLDCANLQRVGKDLSEDIMSISIDHHKSNTYFADINIVDEKKGSTAELLYSFYDINGLKISKNNAECLYTGIYDDSIAFTTSRTNKDTFNVLNSLLETKIDISKISDNFLRRNSLAKFRLLPKIMQTLTLYSEGKVAFIYLDNRWLEETGAFNYEGDESVDMVLNIGIVQLVAYFRIVDGKVRISLRSKGSLDVSKVATIFNGGGHKNASGISLKIQNIEEAKTLLLNVILDCIEG